MIQKKKTNALKNVMMLITTKTHNERGVYLHEYYSTRSTVSSMDWSNVNKVDRKKKRSYVKLSSAAIGGSPLL